MKYISLLQASFSCNLLLILSIQVELLMNSFSSQQLKIKLNLSNMLDLLTCVCVCLPTWLLTAKRSISFVIWCTSLIFMRFMQISLELQPTLEILRKLYDIIFSNKQLTRNILFITCLFVAVENDVIHATSMIELPRQSGLTPTQSVKFQLI